MQDSQYRIISGQPIVLSPGPSSFGNIFHLHAGRRFTLVSGEATLMLQQAAVKGTSGQMEVLSAAMSINDAGEVSMVFPSSKAELRLLAGQSIEVPPGFAYGWTVKQECLLIETPLPELYPFEGVLKSISEPFLATDLDAIPFDLGIGKDLTPVLKIQAETLQPETLPPAEQAEVSQTNENPLAFEANEAVKELPPIHVLHEDPVSEKKIETPIKQRYFKRAILSGFAYLGMLALIMVMMTVTIVNTDLASFSFLYIIILMSILYLGYVEIKDLYEQKPLLCIISDGVVITNRIYRDMPMRWADLNTISIQSKSGLMNSSHLNICFVPHNEQFPIDYLKPEYRLIYNYMCKLKFTPPIPSIRINELDLEESLTEVYDHLKALHTEYSKVYRQYPI